MIYFLKHFWHKYSNFLSSVIKVLVCLFHVAVSKLCQELQLAGKVKCAEMKLNKCHFLIKALEVARISTPGTCVNSIVKENGTLKRFKELG